jgi:U3 small nucleolar RNA-associated protein 15
MAEFKSSSNLQTKRHTASSVTLGLQGTNDLNEARYWTQKLGLGNSQYDTSKRKFAHPRAVSLQPGTSAIVHQVLFGPSAFSKSPPLAVVSGPRVSLYGTAPTSALHRALARNNPSDIASLGTIGPDRKVQTGGNLALCGAFRNDGRLLAVGTDVGHVRVCDATMRATLATFTTHTKLPTRAVQWLRNGQQVFSGGDDGLGRVWDLGAMNKEKPMITLRGHGDAIRCAVLWQTSPASSTKTTEWTQLAMTGSYDHTIRVWNIADLENAERVDRCLSVLSHDAPVEALCLMKSENDKVPVWLLSAGGTTIKVWNPISGKCVSTITTQHRKTITSLLAVPRASGDQDSKDRTTSWRILTSSLEGLLEFHSWDAEAGLMEHLYSTKLAESITSVVMDEAGERIAIGTTSGQVLVKMRGPSIEQHKRRRDPKAGTYAFFQRGMNVDADSSDYLVAAQGKKRKLRTFDVALKQFRYGDALDDALATRRPGDVVAVLEELGKRRGLATALSNRDEELLEPILAFTIRYINRPHFTSLLVGVAHKLIDVYGDVAGQSETIDELFAKLKTQVGNECKAQKSLLRIVGQIDAIMTASEME